MLHHWYKQSNSGELFLKSRTTKRNSLPKFYVLAEAVGDCAFELFVRVSPPASSPIVSPDRFLCCVSVLQKSRHTVALSLWRVLQRVVFELTKPLKRFPSCFFTHTSVAECLCPVLLSMLDFVKSTSSDKKNIKRLILLRC